MALSLRYAVRSDLGLVRGNNEDSVYAGPRLLAIADGMGGHVGGEVASKIVIGTLERLDEDRALGDLMGALREAVAEANHRITEAVQRSKDLEGMGTTLTALRFVGSHVGLVHVGDSRAYLLRDGVLSQITHDDTYVQYLVDSGQLTAEEAKDHPRKSVILRALRGAEVDPDVAIREARAGDRYLLCTDGLSDVVSADTIRQTLQLSDPQESADRLVELALRGGGPDNVTVIVADVVELLGGEVADDMPVVGGAFVDPSAADIPGTDSPAERAAHISRPHLRRQAEEAADRDGQPGSPERRGRRRSRWRTPLVVVGVLALVAAALGGVWAWTQTQYFVGRSGDEVAIFQGVNTSFGPLRFYDVDTNTDLKMDDLDPSARSQVATGITAHSRTDARQIVERLRSDHLLPLCTPAVPIPTVQPRDDAPTPSGSASPTRTGMAGTSSAHPSPAAGRTTSAAPPLPMPSRTPGVDCREQR
jgi:protein phosphatase